MASPFGKNTGPVLKCKRDTHDLSFQSNATYKFGYLYPAFVKEASAGDSWHISPSFGLRFLPTYFPLQTKINAKLDFFYVRYRNLWKDWKNYRYGTGNPGAFPILSKSETVEQSTTGSLGDYMGLPTTLVGNETNLRKVGFFPPSYPSRADSFKPNAFRATLIDLPYSNESTLEITPNDNFVFGIYGSYSSEGYTFNTFTPSSDFTANGTFEHDGLIYTKVSDQILPRDLFEAFSNNRIIFAVSSDSFDPSDPAETSPVPFVSVNLANKPLFAISPNGYLGILASSISTGVRRFIGVFSAMSNDAGDLIPLNNIVSSNFTDYSYLNVKIGDSYLYDVIDAGEAFSDGIPYDVSAMPFRAYEQIYNAFYRDNRNNPFVVNGVYDPNVFLPTIDGGYDTTKYRLHKRNWEQDFLTSAMPSPQYGNAPLVGVTSSGVATFTLDDGTEVQSQLEYDKDDKITGFSTTSSSDANRTLINLASSGISINDLRGVNSMQKYLELHWRRGLRYKDQMLSHRGIDIEEKVLDMPEFIGSVVQRIDVSQINQNAPSGSDPLGSYAGQLSAVGGGSRMTKYCDEDGLIIGIISIVPVPAYSQLLPKHFTKINDPLEYFDPSFRNLGMQAIPYREVCPLQAANSGVPLDSTFGYNRAWYDYLQSQDEIHGQFRTTLNNYVLARVFNTLPSLNEDFLTVDPDSLNDVFSISEVTLDNGAKVVLDSILGQLHFNVSCERQIPRYALPSLD